MLFAFRLCLALGYPHPDVLLREIDAIQLAEWEAYYHIEPFGYHIDNLRAGQICSTVANFSFASKRRNFTAQDFALQTKRSTPEPAESLGKRLLKHFQALVATRKPNNG